jgi:hypothetical protein
MNLKTSMAIPSPVTKAHRPQYKIVSVRVGNAVVYDAKERYLYFFWRDIEHKYHFSKDDALACIARRKSQLDKGKHPLTTYID